MLTPLSSPNSTLITLTYINLNCTNVPIECLRVTRMRLLVLVSVTVHRHTMPCQFPDSLTIVALSGTQGVCICWSTYVVSSENCCFCCGCNFSDISAVSQLYLYMSTVTGNDDCCLRFAFQALTHLILTVLSSCTGLESSVLRAHLLKSMCFSCWAFVFIDFTKPHCQLPCASIYSWIDYQVVGEYWDSQLQWHLLVYTAAL